MSEQITPNPSVPSQVVAEVKFPKFINNLGIIPTSYKDSMSYYECLAWLCKFLEETVIPTVNENGEAVEELQNLYIQLNEYVTNYFDNLDVQEEINNKLDEMVEDGTFLQVLINYFHFVTPEMYGAKGDGISDDTSAFDIMFKTNNSYISLAPNKTYLLNKNFVLNNKNNLIINGNFSTIKMINGTEENELSEEPSFLQITNSENILIKNLIIDVNGNWIFRPHIDWGGVTTTERTEWQNLRARTYGGLRFISCNNLTVDNVKCTNCRTGFLLSDSSKGLITNSTSYKTFADGIFIAGSSSYINVENHYCELCGDDCYSTAGFETKQPAYINFINSNAYNCGGGLLCANSSIYTNYTNINGTLIGYNPFKIESKLNVCENIVLDNCNATTVDVPELEEEYAFVLGKRQTSNNYTSNVTIKNSSFVYPGTETRRIELRHQGIKNLKYINCYYSGVTPLIYENSDNITLDSNTFITQDAFTIESITSGYIKNNKLINKNLFNIRGYNGFTFSRSSNIEFENNKITNETSETSYSIKVLSTLSNFVTDNFDINGYYGNISNLSSKIPVSNSYFFPSCADNQIAVKSNIIGTIVSGEFKDDINTSLTAQGLTCKLFRKGRNVTAIITGNINQDVAINASDYMFSIPENYRPTYSLNQVNQTASGARWLLGLQPDGRFGIQFAYQAITSNSSIYSTTTWNL